MANEILNTDGGATGTQTIGRVVVNTGGRGTRLKQTYSPTQPATVKEVDLSEVTDDFEDLLDEPTYYTGDLADGAVGGDFNNDFNDDFLL